MSNRQTMRVMLIAPGCDGEDVGESWSSFQWVKGISQHCDVTLLTLRRRNQLSVAAQLPEVKVVEWSDIMLPSSLERFNSTLKPGYPKFYFCARRWIKKQQRLGVQFDIIHQLGPIGLRYPCPAAGLEIPVVIGPLAGSLETPVAFQPECGNSPWYTKLRKLDKLRLKYDRRLMHSYASADLVLGVAPYVEELLQATGLRRFEVSSETGVHDIPDIQTERPARSECLRLLYVGRLVRSKGLRDLIRAMGILKDLPGVTLSVAGAGEEEACCKQEAKELGVSHRVHFHGRLPRLEVEQLYAASDLFVFPSFREPSGNVVFEAMRHGLPVVTTDRGGPAFVVDGQSGCRLPARNPTQLADALAGCIRSLASEPLRIRNLSLGARKRIASIGLWSRKIEQMLGFYQSIVT